MKTVKQIRAKIDELENDLVKKKIQQDVFYAKNPYLSSLDEIQLDINLTKTAIKAFKWVMGNGEKTIKKSKLTGGEALSLMSIGHKVKVPEWEGYWFKKNGQIYVHTEDGHEFAQKSLDWLNAVIWRKDWEIVEQEGD